MERISSDKKNFEYSSLDQKGNTIVEYVWIGGSGQDIRCKARTIKGVVNSLEDVEEWNYDGSSTNQATTQSSEVLIRPVALFDDPFRGAPNKIAFCETYHTDGTPTISNFRYHAAKIFKKSGDNDPWFGIEQEYTLVHTIGTELEWPLGWPRGQYPGPQGPYYCSVGSKYNFGREVMDAHYKACLYAGVKIWGTNCETLPGQWEYQIGICQGIEAGDHLWMARYLMQLVGEVYGVDINLEPKPILGDWSGTGGHTNFSTSGTRNDNQLQTIKRMMGSLDDSHRRLCKLYGENNHLRLTGKNQF